MEVRNCTTTSTPSTVEPTPESIYLQEGFPVSPSARPGNDEARAMTARSGRKCSALLARQDPLGCLVRTCLESLAWNSTACLMTWRVSATPRGRLVFRLVPWTRNTDANESGLWPTPNTKDGTPPRSIESLQAMIADKRNRKNKPSNLREVILWPTATANDAKGSAYQYSRGDHSKPVLKLTGAARLFPTPQASQPGQGDPNDPKRGKKLGAGGSLNPEWVEWLMGYPIGHTASADSETPSCRKSRKC